MQKLVSLAGAVLVAVVAIGCDSQENLTNEGATTTETTTSETTTRQATDGAATGTNTEAGSATGVPTADESPVVEEEEADALPQ